MCARVCMCAGAGSWGTRDLWGTVWLEDCSAVTIKSFSVSVSDKKAGTRKALGEKSTDSKELERDKGRDVGRQAQCWHLHCISSKKHTLWSEDKQCLQQGYLLIPKNNSPLLHRDY